MRMMYQFALGLQRDGNEVLLAVGDTVSHSDHLPPSAVAMLADLADRGVECFPCAGFRRRWSGSLRKRLTGLVTSRDVGVLIGFHPLDFKYALSVAGATGRRCVLSLQNRQKFWGSALSRRLKALAFRRMLRRYATRIVCTSESVREDLIRSFGADETRCSVLPNGIPIPQLTVGSAEAEAVRTFFRLEPNDLLLVNTGRIDVQKGQDLLLEALQSVREFNWTLVLIGDVSEGRNTAEQRQFQERLQKLVDDNNWAGRIHFAGWRDDVSACLAAADAYIHAARWEGPAMPLAVLEAMAARLPVVFTDCSGCPEDFRDGTHGFIAVSENIVSMGESIRRMLTLSHEERREMGECGRKLVESGYDIDQVADRFATEVRFAAEQQV